MRVDLEDGNWYAVETHAGPSEGCVVVQMTDLDVWLSPEEAWELAFALMRAAGSVEDQEREKAA